MFGIREKVNNLARLSPKRKIAAFILFIVFASVPLVDSRFLNGRLLGVMWIFDTVMLGILLSVIMIMAGFVVIKSLFQVAVGLSLLIFLAQSYCAAVGRITTGDDALRSILVVGLLYVSFDFLRFLYKSLKETLGGVGKKMRPYEAVITVGLFLMFAGLFMWDIYRVTNPIIQNLCIFSR